MKKVLSLSNSQNIGLLALAALALSLHAPTKAAQNFINSQATETPVEYGKSKAQSLRQRTEVTNDSYILGPGDGFQIELLDLPELSGIFTIGPDGTLYLPRLRAIYVEGLTLEELRNTLTDQFSTYILNPQLYLRQVVFRPVRVFVGGEVKLPGYYTLSGVTSLSNRYGWQEMQQPPFQSSIDISPTDININRMDMTQPAGEQLPGDFISEFGDTNQSSSGAVFPTVFDAIRRAQGVTPYTDLTKVQIIRKRADVLGGGRIKTNINFLPLITNGDESQNIRLLDGDVLNVGKSPVVLREQLIKAGQSNLNPQFMNVFVLGRVNIPGLIRIPQGSSLNQAIALAGGAKLLKGKVEFVRFNRAGAIDRRMFAYNPGATPDAPNNPILAAGDLVRVQDSLVSASAEALNELTEPFVGVFTVYSLFNGIFQ